MFAKYIHGGPLQVVDMTPEDFQIIDPTGRGRAAIARMRDTAPTPMPEYMRCMSRSEWLLAYQRSRASRVLPTCYTQWDSSHDAKYGCQGGHYSLDEVEAQYEELYRLAQRPVRFVVALRGRDYLLRRIQQRIAMQGYPQLSALQLEANASSGLPMMSTKDSFLARSVGARPNRGVAPNLPGQRIQRRSHRLINNDSILNVMEIQVELDAIRKWLSREFPEYFGSWLNPSLYINPTIFESVEIKQAFSVETDFKKCDQHFSWAQVAELILPIYEQLIPNPITFIKFSAFVEQLFQEPVFLGTKLFTGLHNLFSGQGITQDFETIYDTELELGATLASKLDPTDLAYLSLGDDIAVLKLRRERDARLLHDTMVEEGELNGMEFSLEKSRIARAEVHYLRRAYAPGMGPLFYNCSGKPYRKGAYPAVLTLNSIVNPEYATPDSPALQVQAFLQRLDNLEGNPDASAVITWITARTEFKSLASFCALRNLPATRYRDWWERLYGECWSPDSSFALRVLKSARLLPRILLTD